MHRPDLFPDFVPFLYKLLGFDNELFDHFTWIPFGILMAVMVGAIFTPFLWAIGPRLALLMVLPGFLFSSGAIGFEGVSAWMELTEYSARGTLPRNIASLIEEALEMYSIAIFNCVLFSELAKAEFSFHISFSRDSKLAR